MKSRKVVKTFTVDEGVYNYLIEIFKKANLGIGVSNMVDGYLKYIYQALREVLYYVEKNKIDLPLSYVVHKVLDDHAILYMYDWELIERLEKEKGKNLKQRYDEEARIYVEGLIEEYESKHKKKWLKKSIKEIQQVDKSDDLYI